MGISGDRAAARLVERGARGPEFKPLVLTCKGKFLKW